MTASEKIEQRGRTAAAMHNTAQQLEEAEATLHRSAQRSPDAATAKRLDDLGDAVTAEAQCIDQRADRIDDREE